MSVGLKGERDIGAAIDSRETVSPATLATRLRFNEFMSEAEAPRAIGVREPYVLLAPVSSNSEERLGQANLRLGCDRSLERAVMLSNRVTTS